ncbi:MAG: LytTR family DNA-binding domain-containing protein [Eubacteriales bacterium]|nr:LytTR family DNA-binding domain-containing protein [Eubacteriales bacterium]
MNCKRINISICDVSRENCAYISEVIKRCAGYGGQEYNELWIDCFYSGKAFIKAMETVRYDIAFVETNLGDMSGLQIGGYIRKTKNMNQLQLVYMSMSGVYTMELFESKPLHFLIKPINEKRLVNTVCRAMDLVENDNAFFLYVKDRITRREETGNIIYFESMNRQLVMHTINENVMFYGKLKEVYERLKDCEFFYIHQSFLVNYKYVEGLDKGNQIVLKNGERLNVSNSRKKEVCLRFKHEGEI